MTLCELAQMFRERLDTNCARDVERWARELAKAESERYEQVRGLHDDGTQGAILFEIRHFLQCLGVPEIDEVGG